VAAGDRALGRAGRQFGLGAHDVFYFGNAIGETGNDPKNAIVNATDVVATRYNASGFSQVPLTNVYDFDRSKFVNATDQVIARYNLSGFTPLILLTAPGGTTDDPNRATIRTRGGGTVVSEPDPETEPSQPGPDPDHFRASRDRWRASLRAAPARESTDLESLLADIADAIAARWARWK
jgi:hypothetical protein